MEGPKNLGYQGLHPNTRDPGTWLNPTCTEHGEAEGSHCPDHCLGSEIMVALEWYKDTLPADATRLGHTQMSLLTPSKPLWAAVSLALSTHIFLNP